MKSIYINVAMGLGGNISLTYITKELHEVYDEVAVCSPYSDVFECDPYVDLVYRPEEIRDFIMDAKSKNAYIMTQRLYDMNDFIYKKISYSDAWRKLCGLKVKGDKNGSTGEHTLNVVEKYPALKNTVDGLLNTIYSNGFENFILLQHTGSQSPLVNVPVGQDGKPDWSKVPYDNEHEPLQRHIPENIVQSFIDKMAVEHPKTAIVLYSLPNENHLNGNNVVKAIMPYLAYYELAKKAIGAVTIDSSLQHLISGVTKVITVWGHSDVVAFAHEGNKNIIQNCRRDDILYFSALGPSAAKIKYITADELLKEVDDYIFNKKN